MTDGFCHHLTRIHAMIAATPTAYEHIVLDENGIPWIEDANTKIAELVAATKAHGRSAEELAYQHPHLTLGPRCPCASRNRTDVEFAAGRQLAVASDAREDGLGREEVWVDPA
jgi:hypothetical protein